MNSLQKIIGFIFPPYKYKVQRKEWSQLVNAIVFNLPEEYDELKVQNRKTRLLNLDDWDLFKGFKFLTISYPHHTLKDFKKTGRNFKLSGLKIFSKKENGYVNIELLIHNNLIEGLKIEHSNYQLEEFDWENIQCNMITKISVDFAPSTLEIFYQQLNADLKDQLKPDDFFEIEFNNRTYFAFYDLEDGNYLATDKNLKVYSLVHDASPTIKQLHQPLLDVLKEINAKKFDKKQHLEERYK